MPDITVSTDVLADGLPLIIKAVILDAAQLPDPDPSTRVDHRRGAAASILAANITDRIIDYIEDVPVDDDGHCSDPTCRECYDPPAVNPGVIAGELHGLAEQVAAIGRSFGDTIRTVRGAGDIGADGLPRPVRDPFQEAAPPAHAGIDYGPPSDPAGRYVITAPDAGVITSADLVLTDAHGRRFVFAHAHPIVSVGQKVTKGQILGTVVAP